MEELLTALLGSVAGGNRYWVAAPQHTVAPYVVMNRISATYDYTFQGPDGLVPHRVQLDAYGETYTSAAALAAAIVSTLSGYRSGDIRGIFIDSQRDLPAPDAGEVKHLVRVSTDIIIWHRE